MAKYCKSCGAEIQEKRLKMTGYCRECALKAKHEGFAEMWTSPKKGFKKVNEMVFGGAGGEQAQETERMMKEAMNNTKQRKKIVKKLQKKVKKGKYTQEEMDEALRQFDEACKPDDEEQQEDKDGESQ